MGNGKIDDHVRSFGMSGYLLTDEIQTVESTYGIDLGHLAGEKAHSEQNFYLQFEQRLRTEAAAMAAHYEVFYCLENSIRELISDALKDTEPGDWWTERVPEDIRNDVKAAIKKEEESAVTRRSDDNLDYTTFGQLTTIINKNWDVFGVLFTNQRAVDRVMWSLNTLRNSIAHCSPIAEDEVERLALTVKDWFRLRS